MSRCFFCVWDAAVSDGRFTLLLVGESGGLTSAMASRRALDSPRSAHNGFERRRSLCGAARNLGLTNPWLLVSSIFRQRAGALLELSNPYRVSFRCVVTGYLAVFPVRFYGVSGGVRMFRAVVKCLSVYVGYL